MYREGEGGGFAGSIEVMVLGGSKGAEHSKKVCFLRSWRDNDCFTDQVPVLGKEARRANVNWNSRLQATNPLGKKRLNAENL